MSQSVQPEKGPVAPRPLQLSDLIQSWLYSSENSWLREHVGVCLDNKYIRLEFTCPRAELADKLGFNGWLACIIYKDSDEVHFYPINKWQEMQRTNLHLENDKIKAHNPDFFEKLAEKLCILHNAQIGDIHDCQTLSPPP